MMILLVLITGELIAREPGKYSHVDSAVDQYFAISWLQMSGSGHTAVVSVPTPLPEAAGPDATAPPGVS